MSNFERDLHGIRNYTQYTSSITPTNNSASINLSSGSLVSLNFTENIDVMTISTVPSQSASFVLFIRANGGSTIQWPGSFRFHGGAPTLTTSVGALDVLGFVTNNNGNNWYGTVGGQGFDLDATPDAVAWGDITETYPTGPWTYTTQQITGINTAITLQVAYNGAAQLHYFVGAFDPTPNNNISPAANGYVAINNGGTFVVPYPNYFVSFGVANTGVGPVQQVLVTVTNSTDSNAFLDNFYIGIV